MDMRNAGLASEFVNRVAVGTWPNWGVLPAGNRARGIWNELTSVVTRCGFPIPTFDLATTMGNAAAYFSPSAWKVVIGPAMCPDVADRDIMSELLATYYHETRHCEQFYAILRYLAANARSPSFLQRQTEVSLSTFSAFLSGPNGRDPNHPRIRAIGAEYLHRRTGIPVNICEEAIQAPMRPGDPLFTQAREWYDSIYAPGNARMLAQLTNHTTIHVRYNQGMVPGRAYQSAFNAYFSNAMPYELDARDTENLVKDAINRNPAIFTVVVQRRMAGGRRGSF